MPEIERAATSESQRAQLVNLCVQSFEASRDTYQSSYRKYNKLYKIYRGWRVGKFVPYRNAVTIPIGFSLIQSDVAKKTNLIFGAVPYVIFRAVGPEDQKIARKRTALNYEQMEDADTFDRGTRLLTGAALFGTQPYKWYWNTRKELVQFRADLGTGEEAYSGEDVTFDGPDWDPTDVRNFFPQPGPVRIKSMRWAVERFHLDLEDVKRLGEAGFFDKVGVADVDFDPGARGGHPNDEYLVGANPATGGLEDQFRVTDFEKPVEILQYWGRVPRSLSVGGQVNLVITVANRKYLLRARPNPFGEIPFGEYAEMPDPWHWHSPSKAEVFEKLQIATNAMASQKMDVLQLFADPQFLYNRRAAPPARRILSMPGAWHPFDGPVSSENVQPLVPDLRGVQNLYTELEQHAQWMEQGTGIIRDAVQGLGGPDRETARGFLGRMEGANVRLIMEARIAEKQWLEPLAQKFAKLNRAFLDFPRQLRMIGGAALFDPVTMQPVPQEGDFVGVNDMLPDYDARAVGTLTGMSKNDVFQRMIALLQVTQTNPAAIQLVNWFAFFRQLFVVADMPNPDELLGTNQVIEQAVAEAMGAAQGAQSAQGTQRAAAPNVVPLPQLGR